MRILKAIPELEKMRRGSRMPPTGLYMYMYMYMYV
jgi:hypothetical protein